MDPEAAAQIDPRNTRRIIRALEVRAAADAAVPADSRRQPGLANRGVRIALSLPREELYRRIDARVDTMIEAGWLDEVRALLDGGYGPQLPSMSSIGYRELARHLAGEMDLCGAVERIKHRSHRLARGQLVWLRRASWLEWFDADADGLRRVMATLGERL